MPATALLTRPFTGAAAPTSAAPDPRTPAPPRPRDPWVDSAKMLLVTLVVVGHSWTLLPEDAVTSRLYDYLYLWHLPAFVVVTGYLSQRFTYSRANLRRLVTTVAVPYLVFEGLLSAFKVYVGGEDLDAVWLNPHWPMWYLAVLFLWRLVTPALRRVRPVPLLLAGTLAVSLLGGLVDVEALDVTRAASLLFFFTVGLALRPWHLRAVQMLPRRGAALVLVAGLGVMELIHRTLCAEWLYYRTPYADLGMTAWQGAGIRLGLIVVALAMGAAVLSLVPRRDGWFARMGAATLVVYLVHGFVVLAAEYAGYLGWAAANSGAALVLTTAGAVGLSLLIAWRPVASRLQRLVTPLP